MNQEYYFGKAKWVGAKDRTESTFSILKGSFTVHGECTASLNVLGLGFFKCYINGVCINPDTFLPLSSDYEASCDPVDEVLTAHRIYVPTFDITHFIHEGDNEISIHFGGGWYTFYRRVFGLPKAIYQISVSSKDGVECFYSDESCKICGSTVCEYGFTTHEAHDYNVDLDTCENAVVTEQLDTEYCQTDCPWDSLVKTITPIKVGKGAEGIVFDCGENTTGYPVIKINAKQGETVKVIFSEEINSDGKLDFTHCPNPVFLQSFTVVSDGNGRVAQPEFTWFGFRYFEVVGDAEPVDVKVVYTNVPVTSSFECDNETLNWIYKIFLHTMHTNMHTGHPSDCPHLERRGYTGDGQLTCNAVLSAMGAKEFYEKWLQDIADGQDKISGHIQYTAPYIRSGGGPGGWGCAIVEVPYQLYKHYGDAKILEKYYTNMRRYIDYLEEHSEFGLVTSDKAGEWCLGDWCCPNILYPDKDITYANKQVFIPAPFVNTYFMVKSLLQMAEIAKIIGKEEDVSEYMSKADERKRAINAAYFSTYDQSFFMNIHGASAFGLDIGLGTDKTYEYMVSYYTKLGHYDTGIFATDIVTRLLFERGDADLAVDLLVNNGDQGFEHWRQNGATTFHEYWDSNRSRSHNHPMFGAVVEYFFEYLLGIRQREGSAGFTSVVIAPQAVSRFGKMSGSMTTPNGVISVAYKRTESGVTFNITIPEKVDAVFKYDGCEIVLKAGENAINM